MEKFKMQVAYQVAKTSYITNQFETEHFRMDCTAFKDHIVLKCARRFRLKYKVFRLPFRMNLKQTTVCF